CIERCGLHQGGSAEGSVACDPRAFALTPARTPRRPSRPLGVSLSARRHLMRTCAHHRLPSWWPLALAAALVLAPGGSREPEPQEDLVRYWDSRGIISYRYVPRNRPAGSAPTAAPTAAQDAWLAQQDREEAEERQRQDLLAYRERQRELQEEHRRKLQ